VAKILSARLSASNISVSASDTIASKISTQNNSAKRQLSNWLEGDLLMLSKPSFWLEILSEMGHPSRLAHGFAKALPVLAAMLGTLAFWQWNAALLLALLLGTGGSFALLQLLQQKKQPWQTVQQWLNHPQAPLMLSVGSGLALFIATYGTLIVWQDFRSPWLAMLLLTQEISIFAVLGLAVWLMLSRQLRASAPIYSFDRCVAGLLHRDELQRLVAVRQFATLAARKELSSKEQAIAAEYLSMLSRKENDLVISRAIQESLAILVPAQPQLSDRSSVADRVMQPSVRRTERVAMHSIS
jgi:hypothetical protein